MAAQSGNAPQTEERPDLKGSGALESNNNTAEPTPTVTETKQSWRDRIKVHPACEMFPEIAQLQVVGNDIAANGLQHVPVFYCPRAQRDPDDRPDLDEPELLDGRGRLSAMEIAGISLFDDEGRFAPDIATPGSNNKYEIRWQTAGFDPWAYVVSVNIHRRHLTTRERRDVIAKLLKDNPSRSDNAIANLVKITNKTVAKVRRKLEARWEIPNVATRLDTAGRRQPSRKPSSSAPKPGRPRETPAQVRDKRILVLSELLDTKLGDTLEDLVRILSNYSGRIISQITLPKRVALTHGHLRAHGVSLSDLDPTDGSMTAPPNKAGRHMTPPIGMRRRQRLPNRREVLTETIDFATGDGRVAQYEATVGFGGLARPNEIFLGG